MGTLHLGNATTAATNTGNASTDNRVNNKANKQAKKQVSIAPDFDTVGYEMAFRLWLRETNDFHEFKNRVTSELKRLGFTDWAYSRLDIPLELSIDGLIGTLPSNQLQYFHRENFHRYDFTFSHARQSRQPIFRSQISDFFDKMPIDSEEIKNFRQLVKVYEKNNFNDHFAIPLYSKHDNNKKNHALFVLSTAGADRQSFGQLIEKNATKIKIIVNLLENIGTEKHAQQFLGEKNAFDKIQGESAIRLLVTMFKYDLKLYEAAERLHIPRNTAIKQLTRFRNHLDVDNNHGAYFKAVTRGLITKENLKKF